jgi:hypothetical protein
LSSGLHGWFACLVAVSFGVSAHGVAHAQPEREKAKNLRAETSPDGATNPPITERITVIADLDDDDADDRADGTSDFVHPAARVDLVALEARFTGATLTPLSGREHARLVASGRPIVWGERLPPSAHLQGISPGIARFVVRWANGRETGLALDVHGVTLRDGLKRNVDMALERVSLQRTPPARIDHDVEQVVADPDALRVVLSSPEGASLGPVAI